MKFRAEPADVYKHLVSATDKVGGRFRMGAGTGVVVDLAPSKRVVRAWRERDYPEGVFSMAAFTLRRVETGTELTPTSPTPDAPRVQASTIGMLARLKPHPPCVLQTHTTRQKRQAMPPRIGKRTPK